MIKFFSRPTKTLHSGKWALSNKDWRTGLYCPGTKKQPQMPYEAAQEMPFEWIWGITTKYLRRADRRNIRSFRSRHASSIFRSTPLGKKKKIYATTRRKPQEEEILIVLFFFQEEKKKTLGREVLWDQNLPASWTLQHHITLSPLFPIVHCLWQVFRATSRILT